MITTVARHVPLVLAWLSSRSSWSRRWRSSCRCRSPRRSRSSFRRRAIGPATTRSTSRAIPGSTPPPTRFIIAFGSMVFTLLVALPAAFGFVRYRFRGKSALNLLMMLPIIVPAVVSALGYYGFLSLDASRRHARRHDHRAQRAVDPGRLPGHRGGAQGLRPQPRARRHERRRRPAAHLPLGDAAGAAAGHPGRRAVRLPALLQRGGGGDLHRRPRRRRPCRRRCSKSIRLESDPVIAVVSTLLTGAVLLGVLVSLFFRQRTSANAA